MVGEFNMQLIAFISCVVVFLLSPIYAMAYVGPGLGAGTIGVVLGIIGSVFIALFALFWYPFKRFLKKIRKTDQHKTDNQPSE